MKWLITTILILLPLSSLFSAELGAALTIDYYNNPVVDSAPSPVQGRPTLFINQNIGLFNLRLGVGVTTAMYEISEPDGVPVFNDIYAGFNTLEFDAYLYPGLIFSFGEKVKVGVSGGAGARLPIITEIDDGIEEDDANEALDWFYQDNRFLFVGGDLIFIVTLSENEVDFFGAVNYRQFLKREEHWTIGGTAGILWHF